MTGVVGTVRAAKAAAMAEAEAAASGVARTAAAMATWWSAAAVGARVPPGEKYTCPSWAEEKNAHMVHYYASMYGCTFSFNDAHGRSKDEVVAKLREAAWRTDHGGREYPYRRNGVTK
jgi:hypothetical protein